MKFLLALVSVACLPLSAPAPAHHNSGPIYRLDDSVTIKGTVTSFRFLNPHARIVLDVVDEDGRTRRWMAEGANVIALRLHGWNGDEVKPGDTISVTGAPSRDGSPRIEWTEIVLSDGTRLGGGNNFPKERDELFERLEQRRRAQPPAD